MPIQVIPASQYRKPKESFLESLGHGVSKGIEKGLDLYQQHQKQKRYGEALKGVEDIYSDPNLSQEQKFIKAFSSMKEFPEAAKEFSSGISKFRESPLESAQRQKLLQEIEESKGEEDYYNRLIRGDQTPTNAPSNMVDEEEPNVIGAIDSKKSRSAQFDFDDSSTWSTKQIDNFRAYEGKSAKGKSLAKKAQNEFTRRETKGKETKKYQEDLVPFQSALQTIETMEKLGKKGNLGIGTSVRGILSPQTRKDAAEYERLGKSLIQYSSNIPIRNRQEFDTLAHDLYDPTISDDARSGILDAMKRIIQSSMQAIAAPEGENMYQPRGSIQDRAPAQKERPPLTSFLR